MIKTGIGANTITEYNGYYIEFNLYGENEYTVQFCGDDVVFETMKQAQAFIDSVNEGGE